MRQFRPYVELPVPLVDDLRHQAEANGTTVAALCFHWVITAARFAQQGYGHRLPQERRARRGTLGETREVRWPQGRESYSACQALIAGAGSSVAAVLRTAGLAYVEAGGDVVMMAWPPKSALAEAA